MVNLSVVRDFNKSLKSSTPSLTAVVTGGTSGIGRGFLSALAASISTPKVYIVGRKQDVLDSIVQDLQRINSSGQYIPILTGDLTLLSEAKKAASSIKSRETAIDLLFLSTGYLNFGPRDESSEGLDKLTSIRHYSRALLTIELLPLLEAAPSPRVVSVLAGGHETKIFPDDLLLKSPANYSFANAAGVAASYITMSMEQMHKQHPKISFVHAYPGLVRTNILNSEHIGGATKFIVNKLVLPTIGRFVFVSPEESGERLLFTALNPTFGVGSAKQGDMALGSNGEAGSGVYIVNEKQEALQNTEVLSNLRSQGLDVKIWEHTVDEINRIVPKQ